MVALGFVRPKLGFPDLGPTFWKTTTLSTNPDYNYIVGANPSHGVSFTGPARIDAPEWLNTPLGTIAVGGLVEDDQLKAVAPLLTDMERMDPLFHFGQINRPYMLQAGFIETLVKVVASLASAAEEQGKAEVAQATAGNADSTVAEALAAKTEARAEASGVIGENKTFAAGAAGEAGIALVDALDKEVLAKAATATAVAMWTR